MSRQIKICLITIVILTYPFYVSAQSKLDIKKKKDNIEKEIAYTKDLLKQNKKNKTQSLSYLNALERQIKNKQDLNKTLLTEINIIGRQIKNVEKNILQIKKTILVEDTILNKLKAEYSKIIYAEYAQKTNRNQLMFILSSENFNQAYKRIRYLKQYSSFRKNQIDKIKHQKEILEQKNQELIVQKNKLAFESNKKKKLVDNQERELKSIGVSKFEKQQLIIELKKSEQKLRKDLELKQKANKELDDKLRKIIEEEIKKANKKSDKGYKLTPEAAKLSSGFFANKGKLPWPVSKGIIVQKYGKIKHPIFKGVETYNNGVDIATNKNAVVRTVFDGVVSRIFFIKGSGKAVLINHGEYYTVYSGLEEVSVTSGEKVLAKEKIGLISFNERENKSELHFEVWKSYDTQDPSKWLFKAY